jgi:pSer/pThr/pTyr-binding forkhead associated (FHA) protein
MRVVELAPVGIPAAPESRTCGRCRGAVEAGAMFCKFCGAPLGEGAGASGAGALAPPAPLLPHERLELPRENGGRAGTAPMPQIADAPRASAGFPNPVPSPSPIAASLQPQPPPSYAAPAVVISPLPVVPSPPAPPVTSSPPAAPVARIPSAPPTGSRPPEPAPAAAKGPVRGRLVVIAKSGADGPSYPIGDTLDIGRVEGHIVVAEDPYLSPRHVRIVWVPPKDVGEKGKLLLRDMGSTNGVYLRLAPVRDMNGHTRQDAASPSEVAVPLQDQDLILVGQQVLRFEVVKEAESGLGPAVEHGTLLFGSPASPRYARLSQRTVEGITRDVYHVRKVETVLGRESGDVVFTEDPFLSRRHAAVRVLGQGADVRYALVDLGSSNGTFLKIRGETELHPQDHFRVGQQLFRVDVDAS